VRLKIMNLAKRTKIIATIGPASETAQVMKELMLSGVNIFRFNMKHGDIEWHKKFITQAREVSDELKHNLGILIDLQGPEVRCKTFNGNVLDIKKDSTIKFTKNQNLLNDSENIIFTTHSQVIDSLIPGDKVVIDDGALFLEVVSKDTDFVVLRSESEAKLKNNKSMNLVNKDVSMPSLTDEDKTRLSVAEEVRVDFVALSFVREKSDIDYLQEELSKRNIKAKIVSKVESQKGVNNIDEIIDSSYAVMIARGDLGIETPIEGIAYLQKEIIRKCKLKSKPVIVATQMLESMINNKFPTRAEAGDVANAVFDSTDAVMLSGETAYGSFPVDVVTIMSRICAYNEKLAIKESLIFKDYDNTKYIAFSAYTISENSKSINKIVVLTETGYTPRIISSFRPDADIIAVSDFESTVDLLSMSYGIKAFNTKYSISDLNSFQLILDELKSSNLIEPGEEVVAIHGQKFGEPGGTNSLFIVRV